MESSTLCNREENLTDMKNDEINQSLSFSQTKNNRPVPSIDSWKNLRKRAEKAVPLFSSSE